MATSEKFRLMRVATACRFFRVCSAYVGACPSSAWVCASSFGVAKKNSIKHSLCILLQEPYEFLHQALICSDLGRFSRFADVDATRLWWKFLRFSFSHHFLIQTQLVYMLCFRWTSVAHHLTLFSRLIFRCCLIVSHCWRFDFCPA